MSEQVEEARRGRTATWIPRKDAGCVGVAEGLPFPMSHHPGPYFRLWTIPPDTVYFPIFVIWRSEDGSALARGVIQGTAPAGVLADWCDENSPWCGTFTPQMGGVLRGWSESAGDPTYPGDGVDRKV